MVGISQDYTNVWAGAPTNNSGGDFATVTLALRMRTLVRGRLMGVRFFRDLSDGGEHLGLLWRDSDLGLLDATVFHRNAAVASGADGWHSAYFRKPRRFEANERFVVGVMFSDGNYWLDPGALLGAPVTNGNLEIVEDGDGGANGLFGYGALVPTLTFGSSAYGVDVIFLEDV